MDVVGKIIGRFSSTKRIEISAETGQNGIQYVTNPLNFWSGSVLAMTLQQDGNVGIGTASPSATLDVVTSASSTVWAAEINQSNTSNGDGLFVNIGSTANVDYVLSCRSNSANLFDVKGDGNVGINDASPSYKLDVNGTFRCTGTAATGALTCSTIQTSSTIAAGGALTGTSATFGGNCQLGDSYSDSHKVYGPIEFWDDGTEPSGVYIRNVTNGGKASIMFSDQSTQAQLGYIRYAHSDSMSNGTGNSFHFDSTETTTAVVIDQTGASSGFYVGSQEDSTDYEVALRAGVDSYVMNNFGIGTRTANESGFSGDCRVLSIQGSATNGFGCLELRTPDVTSTNRLGEIRFVNLDGTASTPTAYAGIRSIRDGADYKANLSFWTGETSAGILQRLTITSGGDVGIGTEVPAAPLHVRGSLGAYIENTQGATAATLAEAWTNYALKIQNRISGGYLNISGSSNYTTIQSLLNSTTARDIALNPWGGSVGVGTIDPNYLLDVNGTLRARKPHSRNRGYYWSLIAFSSTN